MLPVINKSTTTESNDATFYGLLEPGCSWGIAKYGDDLKVVLFGNEAFLKKNATLFSSFAAAHAANRVTDTIMTVTVTVAQLKQALRLYLYGQLFQAKAITEPVLDNGEIVDVKVLNDTALMTEAKRLATLFETTQMPKAYAAISEQKTQGGSMTIYSLGRVSAEID